MNVLFFVGGALFGALVLLLFIRFRTRESATPTTETQVVEPAGTSTPADQVLRRLNEGVLLLDPDLRPSFMNDSARILMGVQPGPLPGRVPSEDVMAIVRRSIGERREVDQLMVSWFPTRARLHIRAVQMPDGHVLVTLRDITEEVHAQEVRKEFVAHASHELKSPVASLQTLAEAVREAAQDDPSAVTRFADRMVAEATRLGRLVSDLLDLSRLEEAGSIPDETIDLSNVVRQQTDQIESDASAKQMVVTRSIVPRILVKGDAQQLGLMIRNLLDNAVRYTREGGGVTVEVSRLDDEAVVSVSDTGMGIPLEAQSRVFERFYRVDRARSRDRGGTGLGLAIVKHVAELHGGSVRVHSELGEGSTFTASLPIVADGDEHSLAG